LRRRLRRTMRMRMRMRNMRREFIRSLGQLFLKIVIPHVKVISWP